MLNLNGVKIDLANRGIFTDAIEWTDDGDQLLRIWSPGSAKEDGVDHAFEAYASGGVYVIHTDTDLMNHMALLLFIWDYSEPRVTKKTA